MHIPCLAPGKPYFLPAIEAVFEDHERQRLLYSYIDERFDASKL